MKIKSKVILAILLYLVSFSAMELGLYKVGQHPDEKLWNERSYEVLDRYRNDLRHITSHLPHPGLPTSLILALGHVLREKWNNYFLCEVNSECHLQVLEVSRYTIRLLTALVSPFLFILALPYFGPLVSFIAALLLALDPRYISYSRIAHIDGTLTLFFISGLFLYFYGIINKSLLSKFSSGILWGLCLLCKPPGSLLLPILVFYRVIRKIILGIIIKTKNVTLFNWTDVWNVLLGQLVCVLLFTRLWDKHSFYVSRLGVQSELAGFLLRFHDSVKSQLWIFIVAFILVLYVALISWRKYFIDKKIGNYVIANISSLFLIFYGFYLIFPLIVRNLILYWSWIAGLQGVKHTSYGKIIEEEKAPGYLYILLTELPEEIVIGFILGALLVIYSIIKRKGVNELSIIPFTIISSIIVFVGFLSASSKQDIRYLLPVLPLIYLIAVFGFTEISRKLTYCLYSKSNYYKSALSFLLVALATFRLYDWYPYYPAYFNRYNSELKGAIEAGRSFPFVGGIPAIEYLNKIAEKEGDKIISITGDVYNFRYKYKVINRNSDNLKFGFFPPEFADYLFVYSSHIHLLPNLHKALISNMEPEYTVKFKNTDLVRVYRIPHGIINMPYTFSIKKSGRTTGFIRGSSGKEFVRAEKDRNSPGFVFFTPGLRLKKGKYEILIEGQASNLGSSILNMIEIKLNKACHTIDEKFEVKSRLNIKAICELYNDNRLSPSIYWPGGYDLQIDQVKVHKM